MRLVRFLCFLLGGICFLMAYLPQENLWLNMFSELTAIGTVFYLFTIALFALEAKAYVIELLAVLFGVCQFIQFLDEVRGVQWEIHALEIFFPAFVLIFLIYSHVKRQRKR